MNLRSVKPVSETQTRILDAAEELFLLHGFEGASMRMLTARAGVNLAAINYHFGSKDALIEAVLRRYLPRTGGGRSTPRWVPASWPTPNRPPSTRRP